MEDGTLEEFDEDCCFPLQDLSHSSPCSETDAKYTYNFSDIDRISEELDIPWEQVKDLPFSFCTTYIGFEWNLSMMQVSMGEKKKTKSLDSISEWTKISHTTQ